MDSVQPSQHSKMNSEADLKQPSSTPSVYEETQRDEMDTNVERIASENDDTSKEPELKLVMEGMRKAPPFNCKEKIVFFIDISSEMKSDSLLHGRSNRVSFLSALKRTLQMFLTTKKILNADHEYALALMQDEIVFWLQGFTTDCQQISEMIEDLEAGDEVENNRKAFDFDEVVSILQENCEIPEVDNIVLPPPYILRVIFIYGRSNCELVLSKEKADEFQKMKCSPYFFLDVLYVHELPSSDNHTQTIYDFFCNLDEEEKGYVLEVSNSTKLLFETVAKLICHPLQRSPQNEAYHNLKSVTPKQSGTDRP